MLEAPHPHLSRPAAPPSADSPSPTLCSTRGSRAPTAATPPKTLMSGARSAAASSSASRGGDGHRSSRRLPRRWTRRRPRTSGDTAAAAARTRWRGVHSVSRRRNVTRNRILARIEFWPRSAAAGPRRGAVASAIFADFGPREFQSQLTSGTSRWARPTVLSPGYPTRRQRLAETKLDRNAEASKSGKFQIGREWLKFTHEFMITCHGTSA